MKIERRLIGSMDIADFADQHGLTMFVGERPQNDNGKFYAHFKETDVKGEGVLIGTYGDGFTEEKAIAEYAKEISLKRIVVRAGHNDRREIDVPRLTYNASGAA